MEEKERAEIGEEGWLFGIEIVKEGSDSYIDHTLSSNRSSVACRFLSGILETYCIIW